MMDKYVVIGNPVNHSKSPFIHTLFARQTGQQMNYQLLESPLDRFEATVATFFVEGGKGCNVTLPFKEQAYCLATQLTERARLAGAVNTLKKLDDGGILGDNTDGEGLVRDLLNHHINIKGARVLLLGAGGAARGAIFPLLQQKPLNLVISNRTPDKADKLVALFSEFGFSEFGNISATSLDEIQGRFDLIINSTSASLSNEHPKIPTSVFDRDTVVYDMVYGEGVTSSNQWALNNGARHVIDGLGMLVAQAAESFTIWRGIRPGSMQILRELRRNLAK